MNMQRLTGGHWPRSSSSCAPKITKKRVPHHKECFYNLGRRSSLIRTNMPPQHHPTHHLHVASKPSKPSKPLIDTNSNHLWQTNSFRFRTKNESSLVLFEEPSEVKSDDEVLKKHNYMPTYGRKSAGKMNKNITENTILNDIFDGRQAIVDIMQDVETTTVDEVKKLSNKTKHDDDDSVNLLLDPSNEKNSLRNISAKNKSLSNNVTTENVTKSNKTDTNSSLGAKTEDEKEMLSKNSLDTKQLESKEFLDKIASSHEEIESTLQDINGLASHIIMQQPVGNTDKKDNVKSEMKNQLDSLTTNLTNALTDLSEGLDKGNYVLNGSNNGSSINADKNRSSNISASDDRFPTITSLGNDNITNNDNNSYSNKTSLNSIQSKDLGSKQNDSVYNKTQDVSKLDNRKDQGKENNTASQLSSSRSIRIQTDFSEDVKSSPKIPSSYVCTNGTHVSRHDTIDAFTKTKFICQLANLTMVKEQLKNPDIMNKLQRKTANNTKSSYAVVLVKELPAFDLKKMRNAKKKNPVEKMKKDNHANNTKVSEIHNPTTKPTHSAVSTHIKQNHAPIVHKPNQPNTSGSVKMNREHGKTDKAPSELEEDKEIDIDALDNIGYQPMHSPFPQHVLQQIQQAQHVQQVQTNRLEPYREEVDSKEDAYPQAPTSSVEDIVRNTYQSDAELYPPPDNVLKKPFNAVINLDGGAMNRSNDHFNMDNFNEMYSKGGNIAHTIHELAHNLYKQGYQDALAHKPYTNKSMDNHMEFPLQSSSKSTESKLQKNDGMVVNEDFTPPSNSTPDHRETAGIHLNINSKPSHSFVKSSEYMGGNERGNRVAMFGEDGDEDLRTGEYSNAFPDNFTTSNVDNMTNETAFIENPTLDQLIDGKVAVLTHRLNDSSTSIPLQSQKKNPESRPEIHLVEQDTPEGEDEDEIKPLNDKDVPFPNPNVDDYTNGYGTVDRNDGDKKDLSNEEEEELSIGDGMDINPNNGHRKITSETMKLIQSHIKKKESEQMGKSGYYANPNPNDDDDDSDAERLRNQDVFKKFQEKIKRKGEDLMRQEANPFNLGDFEYSSPKTHHRSVRHKKHRKRHRRPDYPNEPDYLSEPDYPSNPDYSSEPYDNEQLSNGVVHMLKQKHPILHMDESDTNSFLQNPNEVPIEIPNNVNVVADDDRLFYNAKGFNSHINSQEDRFGRFGDNYPDMGGTKIDNSVVVIPDITHTMSATNKYDIANSNNLMMNLEDHLTALVDSKKESQKDFQEDIQKYLGDCNGYDGACHFLDSKPKRKVKRHHKHRTGKRHKTHKIHYY